MQLSAREKGTGKHLGVKGSGPDGSGWMALVELGL